MIFILIVFLALAGTAHADSYTFTTTPRQERALTHVIDQLAPEGEPPVRITNRAHLGRLFDQILENYITQLKEANTLSAREMKDKYDNSTPEVRSQIDTLLGR